METTTYKANVPLMLDFVSRSVIHRLNFPKREAGGTGESDLAKLSPRARAGKVKRLAKSALGDKSRPMLSPEDCAEVRQACGEALTATGAFELGKLSALHWLACFRAARAACGMNRRWKRTGGDDESILASLIVPLSDPEADASRRAHLARRAAFMRACLLAEMRASDSRKRKSAYLGHVRTLRSILSCTLRHRGMTHAEIDATGKRVKRMLAAVSDGQAVIDAEAQADALARSKRPASGYLPLESLTASRAMPSRLRPRLAAALGFNP